MIDFLFGALFAVAVILLVRWAYRKVVTWGH